MNDENAINEEETIRCNCCGGDTDKDDGYECDDCGHTVCCACARSCSECRRTVCADCEYDCWDCHDPLCSECEQVCEQCEHTLCDDCSRWCEACDDRICSECATGCEDCGMVMCPSCMENHTHGIGYQYPIYDMPAGYEKAFQPFTFGLEIEINASHDTYLMSASPLIAGWCEDESLHVDGAGEYQTQPLTMRELDDITQLIRGIDADEYDQDKAGGHMHINRTPRQTPARWYWALQALDFNDTMRLNMRHLNDSKWCQLTHDDYHGKNTAVNADHDNTIELRTFGPWWRKTADKLQPAVTWAHTMWRFFQHHPVYKLKTRDIQNMSRIAVLNTLPPSLDILRDHRERVADHNRKEQD